MKKAAWRSALFLALYYGTNAVYQGFMAKYYQQQGMDGHRLMLLLVSFPLFAAFSQPIWGIVSDRMRWRNTSLLLAIGCAGLLMPVYRMLSGFIPLLLLSAAFAAVYPAIQPMSDSIILENLEQRQLPFGPVRIAGCLAFAFSNLIFGRILGQSYALVPFICAGGLVLMFVGAMLLPRAPGHQHGKQRVPFSRVLQLPHIRPLLLLMMLLQAALGYFFSYYSVYFTALPGSSPQLLGLSYFLASLSEIPFLFFGDRLFSRWGAGRLLLLAAFTLAARFLLMGLWSQLWLVFCCQLLHGMGFSVISFSMAKYISLTAPKALRSSAQMLLSIVGFGFSRVFGVLSGALLSTYLGNPRAGFLLMGALCLAAFIGFLPTFIRLAPLNGENSL